MDTHSSSQQHPPTVRPRWAAAVACALLLVALTPTIGGRAAARASGQPLSIVGSFFPVPPPGEAKESYAETVNLFPEPATRRMFVVDPNIQGRVVAYDLDRLTPVGQPFNHDGQLMAAMADRDGTLLASFTAQLTIRLDWFKATQAGVSRIASIPLPRLTGYHVQGLYRAPGSPLVWLLSEPTGAAPNFPQAKGVVVTQIDLRKAAVDWDHDIPDCDHTTQPVADLTPSVGMGYVDRALLFGCAPDTSVSPRGVGQLDLLLRGAHLDEGADPGAFVLHPMIGDISAHQSVFDPASGRLVLSAASPSEVSARVFDGHTSRFVGSVTIGESSSPSLMGIDQVTGRVYAVGTVSGVASGADVRGTPAQASFNMKGYSKDPRSSPGSPAYVQATKGLPVDPLTRRLFLTYNSGHGILVVRDNVPPWSPPPVADLDANTTDIDEAPGRTTAVVSGAAQGFGAAYRDIGGTGALYTNFVAGGDASTSKIGGGTRYLQSAYLARLTFSNGEAAAGAIGAVPDDGETRADLAGTQPSDPTDPERKPVTIPDGDGDPSNDQVIGPLVNWPYQPASCADFGDDAADASVDGARVSCNAAGSTAGALATSRRTDVGPVSIGSAEISAVSRREAKRGTVTTVRSVARGISVLDGALTIGSVEAIAEAAARGRPGTTSASWTRKVTDVVILGERVCTDDCDLDRLAPRINAAFAGRLVVEFPDALLEATKGGYEAAVRRSSIDQLQEMLVNEQPPTRIEIPAMVMSLTTDNIKASRLLVQFAAVEAEARYGITPAGPDDAGIAADLTAAATLGGDVSGPLLGLPASSSLDALPVAVSGPARHRRGGLLSSIPLSGRLVVNGLRRASGLLPMWAVLLLPVYLSARRRQLATRASLQIRAHA